MILYSILTIFLIFWKSQIVNFNWNDLVKIKTKTKPGFGMVLEWTFSSEAHFLLKFYFSSIALTSLATDFYNLIS